MKQTPQGHNTLNVVNALQQQYSDWRAARLGLENTWYNAWAEFIATPEALNWMRTVGLYKKGAEDSSEETSAADCEKFADDYWRHKINTGKGFEIAETLWAYFMRATFTTENWFTVLVHDIADKEDAIHVRNILQREMAISGFRKKYGDWLRQLIVTGCSTMKVDWCTKGKQLKFTPIATTSVYFNPSVPIEDSPHMVVSYTTRRGLKRMVGKYNMLNEAALKKLKGIDDPVEAFQDDSRRAQSGVSSYGQTPKEPASPKATDRLQIVEYYGPMYDDMDYIGDDCYAIFSGQDLLHFEENKRSPYVSTNFISLIGQSWGISPVTASSGLIVADRLFLNKRLDALEASISPAFAIVEGRLVDPDFKIFPGAKIEVVEGEGDAIITIPTASTQLPVAYQEEQFLVSRIDRNVGTIPTVGGGQVRQAERVTAQEINAAKAVGGTRLNEYHAAIEYTATNKMLQLAYYTLHKRGRAVRQLVSADDYGMEKTIQYDPCVACSLEADIMIRASEAILTEANELSRILEFVQIAATTPEMSQRVNWEYIISRIAELQGFKEPGSLLVPQSMEANSGAQAAEVPMTQPEQAAMEAQMAVDGGASMAEQLTQTLSL